MAFDIELAARVRRILDSRTDLVEKHMFGGVCFMVRGHMCCGIVGSTLMVRLDPMDADRLADEPHVRPMDFTGRPMRGFLYVDPEGVATARSLRAWVERTVRFAETKPRKRGSRDRRGLRQRAAK
jgi:hypothetical protein